MTTEAIPSIPPACIERLSITPIRYLGGRVNQHWLVQTSASQLVLRGYAAEQTQSAGYEHNVLRRLHQMGWPVPELVQEPVHELGRLWCLFTLLPGASLSGFGPESRRARGRLLAKLHESTASLVDQGQRPGFYKSDELACDPSLLESIRNYERIRPATGHLLRWHLDKAREMFERIALRDMETIVLHSDFTPWNLLYKDGNLSGIVDFESTHLNYRVADFALAWRGYEHEVLEGYQEIHKLTDRDLQLLIPVFWSWMFIGVKDEINAMLCGAKPPHDFDWPVKQLLKRSHFHQIEPYPGIKGHF